MEIVKKIEPATENDHLSVLGLVLGMLNQHLLLSDCLRALNGLAFVRNFLFILSDSWNYLG